MDEPIFRSPGRPRQLDGETETVQVYMDSKLVNEIDERRKRIPRSAYIREIVRAAHSEKPDPASEARINQLNEINEKNAGIINTLKAKIHEFTAGGSDGDVSKFPAPVQEKINSDIEWARFDKDWRKSVVGRASIYAIRFGFRITPHQLQEIIEKELSKDVSPC